MSCPHVPEMCEVKGGGGAGAPVAAKSIHDNRSPEDSARPHRLSATVGAYTHCRNESYNTSHVLVRSYLHNAQEASELCAALAK
jgi:hypothetical protein